MLVPRPALPLSSACSSPKVLAASCAHVPPAASSPSLHEGLQDLGDAELPSPREGNRLYVLYRISKSHKHLQNTNISPPASGQGLRTWLSSQQQSGERSSPSICHSFGGSSPRRTERRFGSSACTSWWDACCPPLQVNTWPVTIAHEFIHCQKLRMCCSTTAFLPSPIHKSFKKER